jgi:mxaJ protein
MSSRFLSLLLLVLAAALNAEAHELRVCADPDNLPYSHADGSGFENRIARLIADDLGASLAYEWQPLRRGFVRKTAGEGLCDVFIGVPAGFERVLTTRPYYRSGYVFLWRAGAAPLESFDVPDLAERRIGVQLVGNDLAATPPGHALAARGAVRRVRGYAIYGDGPAAARMVSDLAAGSLDAAAAWGPQALYFARRARVRVEWHWAQAPPELQGLPFEFAIAVGVKRGMKELRDEIDAILARRGSEIDAILAEYDVPRLPPSPGRGS